jgi:4-amino-4-deoxy-L-arabinose transferase-like glycosyltransferase
MANWFGQLFESRDASSISRLTSQEAILGDGRWNSAWICNRYGPNFHPPFASMLSNISHISFRGWMDDIASRRMASGLLLGLSAAVLFLFMSRRYSLWAGMGAAALVLMPRVLGHGHIAGTDMPAMALWGFVALAFWNGLQSSWYRHLFGVLLGLSFLVKFSAMLVIIPLLVWLLIYRAVAKISARALALTLGGTIIIGSPLALAGLEIVELSNQIRGRTQSAMLGDVARLLNAPFNLSQTPDDAELQEETVALNQTFEKARDGLDVRSVNFIETRLDLSNYIQFVSVRNLGVQSTFSGWILLLPGLFWVVWSAVVRLRKLDQWRFPAVELWLAGLGLVPMVALVLNPTWWHETIPQLSHYYQITVDRQAALPDIEIFYAGSKYIYSLPWHNGWVLIAITVPMTLLATSLIGICGACFGVRRDPLPVFLFCHLITLPVFRMLQTPAHDGIRLMLPCFFFLAAFVGYGLHLLASAVYRLRDKEYSVTPILVLLPLALLGPAIYATYRTHPYELSYYNQLVGGLSGAHRMGFEPTYWYDAVTPEVLADLNSADNGLPFNAILSLPEPRRLIETMQGSQLRPEWIDRLPEARINPEVLSDLKRFGKLREDISVASHPTASSPHFPHVLLLTHSSKASPFTRLLHSMKPTWYWGHGEVRLLSVYHPAAVARTWAIWLLLDDSDYSTSPHRPKVSDDMIQQIRNNPFAFYGAAIQIGETGLAEAARQQSPEMAPFFDRLLEKREQLEFLLRRHPSALVEATELLNRTLASRPEVLTRIIETEAYLPDSDLEQFLD